VMERIIRAYTNPGDTVLDIFMGSGSTAIAAKRAGRKYIGCERDSEYYEQSLARIEQLGVPVEEVAQVAPSRGRLTV